MFIIETERLRLRNFVEADWPALSAMLGDAQVTRYMHFASWSAEQHRNWFVGCLDNDRAAEKDAYNWAVVLRATERVIGWFGVGSASRPTVVGERDFSYLLAREVWGQGYMTEALRALLAYEFGTLGTPYVSATAETANPASARVMEKAGMRLIKTVWDADWEGNWAERHHYAVSNPYLSDPTS